ncbi:MAG TPA: hypothetical protein IAA51_02695 [Candidatus Cottocaccamicrobium excrementipullorum]|nr:hypothetical protein [Candidatus Cottocaccamicrobium excrementipullorum]
MKKYDLSKIMKRAWELVKKAGMTISSGLKKAWEEAKSNMNEIIKMNVVGDEIIEVNTITGEISGKTYNAKDWIKRNFNAKWNPSEKKWIASAEELRAELTGCADYYKKYIVSEDAQEAFAEDVIVRKELVNRWDGFYSRNIHASGKATYSFVG